MERGQLETLAAPPPPPTERMRTPSQFSITRSHLDSFTYRALVRIISVCLGSSPNPLESPADENPRVSADRIEVLEESLPSDHGGDGRCLVPSDGIGRGIELEEKEMAVISKDLEDDGRAYCKVREGSAADCAGLVDLAVDEKRVSRGQEKPQEWHDASDGSKGFSEGGNSGSALVISQNRMLCSSEFGSETLVDVVSKEVALAVSEVGQGPPQEQLNVSDGSKGFSKGENSGSALVISQDQMLCSPEFGCEMAADVLSKKVALVVSDVVQGKPQEQLNVCNGSLMVCEGENNGNSVGTLQDQMLCLSEFDSAMVVNVASDKLALAGEAGKEKPQEQHVVNNESPMICEGENTGNLLIVSEDGMPEVGNEMMVDVRSKELGLEGKLWQEKPHEQHDVSNGSGEVYEGECNTNKLVFLHDQMSHPSESGSETVVNVVSKDISILGELQEKPQEQQQNASNASVKVYKVDNNANTLVISQNQLICPSEFDSDMVMNSRSEKIGKLCELGQEGPRGQQSVSNLSAKAYEGRSNARTLVSQVQMVPSSEFHCKKVVNVRSEELCFEEETGQENNQEQENTSNRSLEVGVAEENGNALVISLEKKVLCPSALDSGTAVVNVCLKELMTDSHDRIMLCLPRELSPYRKITESDDLQDPTLGEYLVEDYKMTNKELMQKDSARLRTGLVNDEDMEEGEILDVIEIDNHCSDLVCGSEFINHERFEGGSNHSNCTEGDICSSDAIFKVEGIDVIDDINDNLLLISSDNGLSKCLKRKQYDNGYYSGVCLPNVAPANGGFPNEGKTSKIKVDGAAIKKKRGPMTEERKAKKKKAKKRKRAQKEREQGVKRLKLQPLIKPKAVKYCEFYLKGRCQQGNMCKFSHDTTPLTKSQPCKYFACDICLKGDDCPFDHELSKYPCHNFMSKGMCIRGDKCKFSHKVPNLEVTSTTTLNKFSIPPPSNEKSNLSKQVNVMNDCLAPYDTPKSSSSRSTFSVYEDMKENLVEKFLKCPLKIPIGMRFLSFEKEPLEGAVKHQNASVDEGSTGVPICNQQIKDKMAVGGNKNLSAFEKPLPVVQQSSSMTLNTAALSENVTTSEKSKNDNFGSLPVAGDLQNELLDATRILEEFLFCGDI